MKLSSDFILKELAGNHVLIAVGQTIEAGKNLLYLNNSGAFILGLLQKDTSYDELLTAMKQEYEPENPEEELILRQELDRFLDKARSINAISD